MFVGLQLGQIMSTIDGTIVATALPTIARIDEKVAEGELTQEEPDEKKAELPSA